jgi:hypothetical protein
MAHRTAVALLAAFATHAAYAQQIVHAAYDKSRDAVVVDIAYRGTHNDHPFAIEWGACRAGSPNQTSARLSDLHGYDPAKHDYRIRVRIGLDGLPCRPVRVTLRLGRISHATIFIPVAP